MRQHKTRSILPVALTVAAGLAIPAAPAGAVTAGQLQNAHWDCVPAPPITDELHCAPPGGLARMFAGEARTMTMRVFSADGTTFLGTELNVRDDIFNNQPCPTDPPFFRYVYLGDAFPGLDYWACHHFDSDHT